MGTRRTWAALASLYADNTSGDITPERLRDGFASVEPHSAAAAPTVNSDTTAGFDKGHAWIDTSTTPASLYRCLDATAGAAVWAKVYPAAGGGDGDVVGPASAVDERIAVFDGTTGKLIKDGGSTIASLAGSPGVEINAQTGTTYTLVLADADKLVTLDNGAAITLTVPTNASVAFPVGTVIAGAQIGAGLVSIAGATGVTINGVAPGAVASAGQWSAWSLTKLATDTWLASGGLA